MGNLMKVYSTLFLSLLLTFSSIAVAEQRILNDGNLILEDIVLINILSKGIPQTLQ